MEQNQTGRIARRGFLKHAGLSAAGAAALMTGCGDSAKQNGTKGERLKAYFSNGGLTTTWCKRGQEATLLWAELLGIDVVWVDGELNQQKQRQKIDLIVDEPMDFFCVQTNQIGALAEPVKRMAKRNIPVISIDTLLVPKDKLRETGVWTHVSADHMQMAVSSTQYLMDRIGGKGNVIHIGGYSGHSGAQGRAKGFDKIKAKYPDVKVIGGGVRWCDWKTEKARDTFDSLLQQSDEPIAGAFFHNDDMALACVPAIKGTPHEKMVVTGVDGQEDGLNGVRDGRLAATTINPSSMVHMTSLAIGQFIVRNQETVDNLPLEIPLPTPLVSKETGNLDAMLYMSGPKHCLV